MGLATFILDGEEKMTILDKGKETFQSLLLYEARRGLLTFFRLSKFPNPHYILEESNYNNR